MSRRFQRRHCAWVGHARGVRRGGASQRRATMQLHEQDRALGAAAQDAAKPPRPAGTGSPMGFNCASSLPNVGKSTLFNAIIGRGGRRPLSVLRSNPTSDGYRCPIRVLALAGSPGSPGGPDPAEVVDAPGWCAAQEGEAWAAFLSAIRRSLPSCLLPRWRCCAHVGARSIPCATSAGRDQTGQRIEADKRARGVTGRQGQLTRSS
jgi:hypothetical protein